MNYTNILDSLKLTQNLYTFILEMILISQAQNKQTMVRKAPATCE